MHFKQFIIRLNFQLSFNKNTTIMIENVYGFNRNVLIYE